MQVRYFINRQFEDVFIPEIEVSEQEFCKLSDHAQKWVTVIASERGELAKYENDALNLVYNMADASVTPRDFSPFDVIRELNAKVNCFQTQRVDRSEEV
jgi:hypothetical protein